MCERMRSGMDLSSISHRLLLRMCHTFHNIYKEERKRGQSYHCTLFIHSLAFSLCCGVGQSPLVSKCLGVFCFHHRPSWSCIHDPSMQWILIPTRRWCHSSNSGVDVRFRIIVLVPYNNLHLCGCYPLVATFKDHNLTPTLVHPPTPFVLILDRFWAKMGATAFKTRSS